MGLISPSASIYAGVFCFPKSVSRPKSRICNTCETNRILHNFGTNKFIRINTCKSIAKQTTLTPSRMNTYAKPGGGEGPARGGTDRADG